MSQGFPISLPSLPEREAIVDALYRITIGLDTNDQALFESGWIKESESEKPIFDMNGNARVGLDAINQLFGLIGPLDTTHFLSNVRINRQENTNEATITTHALAQHYRTGTGATNQGTNGERLLTGALYWVDVVKDNGDGMWKVKKWALKIIWREGDMSIVTPK